MAMGIVEQHVEPLLNNTPNNSQPLFHHISYSSAIGTMIPAPGMPHNGGTNSSVTYSADNSMISSGASLGAPTTVNMANLQPIADGSVEYNASFSVCDASNGYQPLSTNFAVGSSGNDIVSSMGIQYGPSHMIPTPCLNNLQSVSMNPEYSNGAGNSNAASTVVHQQQLKQYIGSQNSRMLHSSGDHVGARMSSKMQYGFGNGVTNGGLGLLGSNMHLVSGPVRSEGNLRATPYGSGNLYDPSSAVAPSISNDNLNHVSMLPKPRNNTGLLVHRANNYPRLQSMHQIPNMISQMSDHSHTMKFTTQPSREHMLQVQHHMRNYQHQQLNQQPIQPYLQSAQQQHRRQQQQQIFQDQIASAANSMRQSPMTSSFGGQLIHELGIESPNELLLPLAPEQFHLSELHSQSMQHNSNSDNTKGAQLLDHTSAPQEFRPTFIQHQFQAATELQNNCTYLSTGSQQNKLHEGDWCQPTQREYVSDRLSFQQQVQENFHQRVPVKVDAEQPHVSFDGCITGHVASGIVPQGPQPSSGVSSGQGNYKREQDYLRQRRWLLLLLHARGCQAPQGMCPEVNCTKVQHLCTHMVRCISKQCGFPRCCDSKMLYNHYRACRITTCPVCIPVRKYIDNKTQNCVQINDSWRSIALADTDMIISHTDASTIVVHQDPQSAPKRIKLQHDLPSFAPKKEPSPLCEDIVSQSHSFQEPQPLQCEEINIITHDMSEVNEVKMEASLCAGPRHSTPSDNRIDNDLENVHIARHDVGPLIHDEVKFDAKQENMLEKESINVKTEVELEANALPTDPAAGSKSGKPKIKGVSLTELFTPEQVGEHIRSLRLWIGQSKSKVEKNQAMEHSMNENSCQLCAVEKLTFEPPPIYCSPCGVRIKRNAMYYTMGNGDTRQNFCIPCYNEARGDTIEVEGSTYLKTRLEKKKNDEETEEWWVQCDKCEAWQHQICALFNGRRNDGGQAEYTCPNCYIKEVERGERKPLPQSSVLGAKDLPRTILSDHIEERLFGRLKQEREERARHLGKSFDEVPGAEGLVVRVVSSVDKKLEVKQRFLEIFQEENYPKEFPYKSKVLLLFQKIEGVEVCLFGMYLQEFGSECQYPNQRRIYLSYLDSVKYFRPETKTVTGEALRTFVYHEILIGYLDYSKKRGFTSCYIWACPPLKGEDYILYCHPEIQKTPKSDKLREWYLSMLRKASKESIVVELTNLYDHFFITMGECKAKVTAARLPYFDGDYWPGAAEDMINQLRQEEDGRKLQKKGKTKKILTKRALKAAGHADLSGNASKDALLMQKLGETICPMKEDFIMVHLQHACTHCCLLMVSGKRWVCKQCKNFQLCDKCHDAEQRLEGRDRHPIYSRDKHVLFPVEINDVTSDTKDKDDILESEFFDTRQAFLSLCQGNHYQYDTLRRAKHSSIMVLYHLHNPTAPAFVTTCNMCYHDIEAGQGWRCEICPEYDVCHACYQNGSVDHPHKLTNHPSMAERDAQNKEARQKRVLQLRKMLDLLVHASQCRFPHCQYPNCRKVKGLFRHGMQCKTRATGGCPLCKKMWYLLQLHARACKESGCHVPRCRDLREHLRRMQQQSESRRRAAVMEMVRQRAAEVTGNSE